MYTLLTASDNPEVIVEEVGRIAQYLDGKVPTVIEFGIKVILALIAFAIGRKIIKLLKKIVRTSMEKSNVDKGVETFVD